MEDDHGLVAEWQELVEHPAVVVGQVPAEFRDLPREVLETVLVHHQKYIPLLDGGKVARFAALTNTDGQTAPAIVRNMERVVVARLRDAAFFWKEDRKRPLADRVADLAGVTFHQGLGSYLDKANRLEALVGAMDESSLGATAAEGAAVREFARKAARLSKADLTTAMVREFPELQGTMGGIYLEAGRGPARGGGRGALALSTRLARGRRGSRRGSSRGPALAAFAAVSLADKLDTLAGYFGLGLQPTGSSDPFGLRRAGQGVVRVLLDFWPAGKAPALEALVGGGGEGPWRGAQGSRPETWRRA